MSQPHTTQVDPQGLAKLYLRTPEIPDFFEAQQQYYNTLQTTFRSRRKKYLWITAIVGVIGGILLLNEFGGDDEGVFVIFWGIGALISLVVIGVSFGSKIEKVKLHAAKSKMLSTFFDSIAEDLHPDSGLKGTINHGKPQNSDIYKRKTSPYSGAKKTYYKFSWANLKFMLIDGTTLRLRCTDKLKEKSGSVVRFQEIGKARMAPNTLIYDLLPGQHLNVRKDLCTSQNELIQNDTRFGLELACLLKETYRSRILRRSKPLEVTHPAPPSHQTSPKAPHPLKKVQRLLDLSALPLTVTPLGTETLELRYQADKTAHVLWLDVQQVDGEAYIGLRLPILGEAPPAERLLKANPALAYGRFAYSPQKNAGRKQLCLFKVLLWQTLDREELETAIQGLCQLGNRLAQQDLPQKTKAYRAEREPDWEHSLLESMQASLPLLEPIVYLDNKAKVRLRLPDNRQQTVHIRFDRQDLDGNQLIALQSFCGADSPDLYDTALEENSHYAYGALGLDTLGETSMFVVCDNQLADTADPPELAQAILHVAQKADAMEALLTGADVH